VLLERIAPLFFFVFFFFFSFFLCVSSFVRTFSFFLLGGAMYLRSGSGEWISL